MPRSSLSPVQSLAPGARVALVAPSGPLRSAADVEQGMENARSFGWEPVLGAHLLDRYSYFAATDAQRLDDFNCALQDDSVDAIWCVRGGYGAMRILRGIDYDALTRHPRPIIGYSDITALHAAIGMMSDVVSYHGPGARTEFSEFARDSFARALVRGEDSCGLAPDARVIRGGVAQGRLVGGNLALIASLTGTEYFPDMRGGILVLEDVNEGLYRVDRMLTHLLLAGALDDVAGIAFGYCTGCDSDETPDDTRLSRTLDDVLREITDVLRVPCITGIPLGHVDDQWTIPLGAFATLDADALTLNAGTER